MTSPGKNGNQCCLLSIIFLFLLLEITSIPNLKFSALANLAL